jgi:hypothetical protein
MGMAMAIVVAATVKPESLRRSTNMRYVLIALSILLGTATPTMAQVSVSVSIPGVTIGINQPVYPDLVLVPGYPVYYAPQAQTNYFFYDGLYWVYQDDRWYMSSWYNGPWDLVEPDDVPLFVLRVPVRYYVAPPVYFRGWVVSAPPRWELYWGPRWTRYHHGWDHWDRRVMYAPAPLPVYQRHYHGDRYPQREYQRVIRHEHYHYQPRDQVVRRHEQQRPTSRPQEHAQPGSQHRQVQQGSGQQRPDFQREQRPQREREESRRSEPTQSQPVQRTPAVQEQQRPQARQEPERRAEPQQRESREREESRRPENMQILPQQRAAAQQERQQQQQQQERQQQQRQQQQERQAQQQQERQVQQQPQRQEAPRTQQAPRPQQAQDRGAQDRGDRQSPGNQERRQGSERGGDRGTGRG